MPNKIVPQVGNPTALLARRVRVSVGKALFWIFCFPWAFYRYVWEKAFKAGAKDEREKLVKALQGIEREMKVRNAGRALIKVVRYTISIVQRRHNLIAADEADADTVDVLVGEASKDDIARAFGGKK